MVKKINVGDKTCKVGCGWGGGPVGIFTIIFKRKWLGKGRKRFKYRQVYN